MGGSGGDVANDRNYYLNSHCVRLLWVRLFFLFYYFTAVIRLYGPSRVCILGNANNCAAKFGSTFKPFTFKRKNRLSELTEVTPGGTSNCFIHTKPVFQIS